MAAGQLFELKLISNTGSETLTLNQAVPKISRLDFTANGVEAVRGVWAWYTEENYKVGSGHRIDPSSGQQTSQMSRPRRFLLSLLCGVRLGPTRYVSMQEGVVLSARPLVGQIILYSEPNYEGEALTLNDSAINLTLAQYDFNDKTRSFRIISGNWILYTNVDYEGNSKFKKAPRAVSSLSRKFDGTISSVELVP